MSFLKKRLDSLRGEHLSSEEFFIQTCFLSDGKKLDFNFDREKVLLIDRFDPKNDDWIKFSDYIQI